MNDVLKRLGTFQDYSRSSEPPGDSDTPQSLLDRPSAVKLAEAGFLRTPGCRDDEAKCYCCGVKYRGWKGKSPQAVHRTLSPHCPHVMKMSSIMTSLEGNTGYAVTWNSTSDVYGWHQETINNRPSDDGSMNFEKLRLLTFPSPTNHRAQEFARLGFKYFMEGMVRCVFCLLQLPFHTENPSRAHETRSVNCPLVRKLDVGNIPIDLEEDIRSTYRELYSEDEESCVGDRPIVKHPQYSDVQTRVDSFTTWPVAFIPTPNLLAPAGFFYTGYGDKVRCYFCGITLLKWRQEADPWFQHARQAPHCEFVKQKMGNNFMAEAPHFQILTDKEPQREDDRSEDSLLRPSLDMNALKAAMSQYDVTQIRQAILMFFLASHGFYPDKTLLLATLQAIDVNFIQMQRQGGQLNNEVQLRRQIELLLREVMEENNIDREEHEMRLTQELNLRQGQAEVIQHHNRQLQTTRSQLDRQVSEVSRLAEKNRRKNEENRRQAEELERLRRLLEANNIVDDQINDTAADDNVRVHHDNVDNDNESDNDEETVDESGNYSQCEVCTAERANCVLLPCGHVCGSDCSLRFFDRECPFCRAHVEKYNKFFIP